jgi:hypothetical protein
MNTSRPFVVLMVLLAGAASIAWLQAASLPQETEPGEITANGRQITITLNGTAIVDANLDDVKDEAVLREHRDLSKAEGSRGIANTTGHIGFPGHGAHVEFRNLRTKEM